MKDKLESKAQLIAELETLRSRLSGLELRVNAREEELKREIEERKKAEVLLKESAEKFRFIFESSNDAIMLLDKREFFDCNDATLRIFGCSSKEDFVGRHPSDWSPALQPDGRDSRRAAEEKISDAYRIGRNFFEWMHLRADGEEFPAEVLLTPMRLEGREVLQATVRDITERKRAEEALQEAKETYQSMFLNSQVGLSRTRLSDGKFMEINDHIVEMFGYEDREDFVANYSAIKCYAIPGERERLFEMLKETVEVENFVTLARRKDGSTFWIQFSARINKERGFVDVVSIDINERKEAEDALSESDERFRNIVENAKVWIWEVNFEGRYTYASPMVEKILGYKPEEVVGRYFYEFIEPDEREILKKKIKAVFSSKKPFLNVITSKIHKAGDTIFCETSGVPIIDCDGKLIGYRGSVSDINERKEAEDALRKNEELLQNIIDNTTAMVYVKDMDGKYLLINSTFEELFHIERGDILEKCDHDIFPGGMADAFRANDLMVLEAGEPVEFEEITPHDDGPHTYISVKFPLYDDEGKPYAVCGISTNITERKRVSERIEALNRCFLDFGTDPIENITRLTSLLGTLMKGTCALYNRLDDGLLYSTGQWQTPPGYNPVNTPEGQICYEVIKNKGDDIFYVPNLSKTPYARTDKNVLNYNLETYLGKAVTCNGEHVGSLSVVFQEEFVPSEVDRRYLEIIAVAIGIEEERKQAGEELATSREKLRNLSLHLQTMQEQERARIARDIHDDLGQILTALDFDIAYMTKRLLPSQNELIEKAKKMSELIKVSTQTVQRIASELRPALLDDLGLMAAMEWQAEKYKEHTGIYCKVIFDKDIEIDNRDLSTALFRAFQEALTNAARHSEATDVSARVQRENGCLVLQVSDNGKGIRPEDISDRDSFGLSGMRERFVPFEGTVKIEGIKDKGTTIHVTVPFGGDQ